MRNSAEFLKNAYMGKRVLVTGHTGFKGSWLINWLLELGAKVIGYALDARTERDNFILSGVNRQILDIRGDIRDYENLQKVFDENSPEIVFHLAAQAIVKEGYRLPKDTFDINVGGSVNVLEACRHTRSVGVVINITSDKCYENREWLWGYRENDPMGGFDPYSASKGCSELITAAYRNSFFKAHNFSEHGIALSSVRAGNVIGGGDWALDRIIPDCIRALERKTPIKVRNPQAVRPWQYVLEPLGGYLLLGALMSEDPLKFCGAWNFGPEAASTVPVREIVDIVISTWGCGTWECPEQTNQVHEATMLALDVSKARWQLYWKPVLDIEESIQWTIKWYKACYEGQDMSLFGRQQIQKYMEFMSER